MNIINYFKTIANIHNLERVFFPNEEECKKLQPLLFKFNTILYILARKRM